MTSEEYSRRSDCRLCGAHALSLDLPLKDLPIGDRYVPPGQEKINSATYPLEVMRCGKCGHYQNGVYVNPELIYPFYLSRPATTNAALSDAYREYADHLLTNYKPDRQPFSVETGSNDGAFSRYMKEKGARILCIEPAPNLVEQANGSGIPTLPAYFSEELAKKIRAEHGAADYIIGNHMFSNVNDLEDFAKGVRHLLADSGVFAMQTFYYVDVLGKFLLENYTHEHLSYFYVKPLRAFFERFDLELFDVKRVPAKAGSIRCFIQRKGGPRKIEPAVQQLIDLETGLGLGKPGGHDAVRRFIDETKSRLHGFLAPAVKAGKVVAGFGTSTGATTFMFNFELGGIVKFFVDDDTYRHNLISPGLHIPVFPSKAILEKKPDYVLIMAPLYADNIIGKNKEYLKGGGSFVKFWPKFEVVSDKEALHELRS